MDVTTQLHLGEAGDCCDHPGASGALPGLRGVVDVARRDGWANLSLHWTGVRWDLCGQPRWSNGDFPTEEVLREAAVRALEAANAITAAEWHRRHRHQLDTTLKGLRHRLDEKERQVRCLRAKVRSLECAAAAAGLEGDPAMVARRLLRDWRGSADELIETANAVAADPGTAASAS